MRSSNELPWPKMHEFLLDVGNVREPRELSVQVISKVYALTPYDQARVYFVDSNGKVCDAVLVGVDPTWNDVYLGYYSTIENGRWSIPARMERSHDLIPGTQGNVYDWTKLEPDEFVDEYIRPQRLHYTAGFPFHDADGLVKSILPGPDRPERIHTKRHRHHEEIYARSKTKKN